MRNISISVLLFMLGVSCLHAQPPRGQSTRLQWARIAMDSKGGNTSLRPGAPHPLQYFLTPSPERDHNDSLLWLPKNRGGTAATLRGYSIQKSLRFVRQVVGRKIYEIRLVFRGKTGSPPAELSPAPLEWKSIVMQASGKLYRELYMIIDDGIYVRPLSKAELLTIGGHRLLATSDPVSGNGGYCTEGYWVLEADGPWLLDFSYVDKAIGKVAPPNTQVLQTGCWALSLRKLEVAGPVQEKDAECHACGYVGTAVVHFRIEGHRAVPVSSVYKPDSD